MEKNVVRHTALGPCAHDLQMLDAFVKLHNGFKVLSMMCKKLERSGRKSARGSALVLVRDFFLVCWQALLGRLGLVKCGVLRQPLSQHVVALCNSGLEECAVVALDVVPRSVNLSVVHLAVDIAFCTKTDVTKAGTRQNKYGRAPESYLCVVWPPTTNHLPRTF